MNKKIKQIAISGGNGKMGIMLSELIEKHNSYEISGIYDPITNSDKYHSFKNYNEINADYLFEFSPSDKINENIKYQLHENINYGLIVGSSGLTNESIDILKKISEHRLVIIIPNFSLGASYQKTFSGILSRVFNNKNIIEKHHSNKKDAPSGTAIDVAKFMESGVNNVSEYSTKNILNIVNNVLIESIRSDDYLAEQVVSMSNEYESFTIEHVVKDRKAYLSGINLVLDNLDSLEGYNYGITSIFKDKAATIFNDRFNK